MRLKRRNKLSLTGLVVILILGPMVYFGLLKPHKTVAAWFNDGWHITGKPTAPISVLPMQTVKIYLYVHLS